MILSILVEFWLRQKPSAAAVTPALTVYAPIHSTLGTKMYRTSYSKYFMLQFELISDL
ncbi:hypothetical protein [Paenibacillus alginolyticus]|uniref:hypothetical protein n=1 Tax=Paenibacillus alginolyticus TaxID=59839 RepID=UPI002DB73AAD|nr:hypothetical protein [Paenibacillus alginolyticus]MEC0145706.1 hypothetical protein [Paenibacillus alginolyticus]